jgi:hypothetical protein
LRIPTLKYGMTVLGKVKYPEPIPKVILLVVRLWKDAFDEEKLLAIRVEKPVDR